MLLQRITKAAVRRFICRRSSTPAIHLPAQWSNVNAMCSMQKPLRFHVRFTHQNASEDALWREVKDLHVRAYAQDAAAQYELGLMYLEDDEDEQEDVAEWELDAEALRQKANDPSTHLRDIKSIRKNARALYKSYIAQKTTQTSQPSGLVQRATPATLDAVFGAVVKPLLDATRPLQPLGDTFDTPEDPMELMRESNGKAIEWLRRAADGGHRDAYVRLGNLCMAHDPPLVHAAMAWYSALTHNVDAPHPDALYNLGMLHYEDHPTSEPPVAKNLELAMSYFMEAAQVGDPSAQFFMGHVLHVGNDVVAPNAVSSLMLLEQAAQQGHGGALYYLAQLHHTGDEAMGIAADIPAFVRLVRAAADQDDDDALVCLADFYREGLHVPEDVTQAHALYERAARLGNAEALCTLGALAYANHMYKQAFQFYQAAADRHSLAAWKNLADMYFTGRGVPQNKKTAQSILDMLRKMDDDE
ncbi:Aste57867_25329 [Aphanomyces stellatus]|uniref:Aste57867_25329 protein n=1 Tax=Aphanomyces stellatus TaxID=120398 RepID=A0A485LST7_9STRA|nr:hypothetical protein As57867_025251 [Aphanomyces stellatus]VFU01954.1 Aste57867_25329 [Aphanomyces stellatus]